MRTDTTFAPGKGCTNTPQDVTTHFDGVRERTPTVALEFTTSAVHCCPVANWSAESEDNKPCWRKVIDRCSCSFGWSLETSRLG